MCRCGGSYNTLIDFGRLIFKFSTWINDFCFMTVSQTRDVVILDVACNRVNDDGSDGERILSAEQKGSGFLLDLVSVVSDLKSHLL